MTDNTQQPTADDLLLEQFFKPCSGEQLADDGFSRRVMTHIAETDARRARRLSWQWTAACLCVALVVFTLTGGWYAIVAGIVGVLTTMPTTTAQLIHLMACGAVLTTLVAAELVRREHRTMR